MCIQRPHQFVSSVVINKCNEVSSPFCVDVGNGPHISVWINYNNSTSREDPFPVEHVFLPFLQLTHFSISLTSNGWRTHSMTK